MSYWAEYRAGMITREEYFSAVRDETEREVESEGREYEYCEDDNDIL